MAIAPGAAGAGLPDVPDLGRPIAVDLDTVKRFVDAGAALIVDAREADEYAAGHIPGAVSLPYDATVTDPARLESLETRGLPIITYCGGGACELSLELAHELMLSGHRKVLVYMGGFPEWTAAGHPVETAATGG
jgi:3-mercaptopyruvate sulfurtransferase SseA